MFRIYIVEDDEVISGVIKQNLEKWGYEGFIAKDFDNIYKQFLDIKPHLVLMDIVLPKYDGYYWCSKIRNESKVPIIFISSKDSNMDIIMAVNMGGDEYIQKPFSIDVLLAKMNAILRRTYSYINNEVNILSRDNVFLNLDNCTLSFNDNNISLTKNEFQIMQILLSNAGKVVSRDYIMRKLWEHESFVDDNTLTVNINRLRKKLEEIDLNEYIITKKGQGYLVR